MNHRFIPVIIIAAMIAAFWQLNVVYAADGADGPVTGSEYVILIETDREQIIYKKNTEKILYSYTTAIAMTAILAIEMTDKPSMVTISSIIDRTTIRTLDIKVGEKYPFDDLLYVMLLRCAPDITLIIADSVFTDLDGFIDRMNSKAASLGMTNTAFYLAKDGDTILTSSTNIDDMAKLFLYCLRNSTFKKIFMTNIFLWPVTETESKIISNSNDLINRYDNVIGGIKSIITDYSNTFTVTASSVKDLNLLCITADDDLAETVSDVDLLNKYASENYKKGLLVAKGLTITEIDIAGTVLKLSSNTDIYYTFPIGQSFVKNVTYTIRDGIKPPILKNVSIGTAIYHLSDGTEINVPLYPDIEILPKVGFIDKMIETLKEHKDMLNVIYFLLILEAVLMIYKISGSIKKHRS
jgi:serine-type D-Ala-D-Ala carboxypeptidase (penicillin-binding protein 5/6)